MLPNKNDNIIIIYPPQLLHSSALSTFHHIAILSACRSRRCSQRCPQRYPQCSVCPQRYPQCLSAATTSSKCWQPQRAVIQGNQQRKRRWRSHRV